MDVPDLPRVQHVVPYHVVSRGHRWCESPAQPLLALEAGDVLVVPHGQPYQLASAGGLRTGWSLEGALSWFRAMARGRALASIHAEPARTWTLLELAHEAGSSRSAGREFTSFVGPPPMLYPTRRRMQLAASRLSTSHRCHPPPGSGIISARTGA